MRVILVFSFGMTSIVLSCGLSQHRRVIATTMARRANVKVQADFQHSPGYLKVKQTLHADFHLAIVL